MRQIADDIRSLIPRSKYDTARAKAEVAAGYPAVAPILPKLLETVAIPLIPYIRAIL